MKRYDKTYDIATQSHALSGCSTASRRARALQLSPMRSGRREWTRTTDPHHVEGPHTGWGARNGAGFSRTMSAGYVGWIST